MYEEDFHRRLENEEITLEAKELVGKNGMEFGPLHLQTAPGAFAKLETKFTLRDLEVGWSFKPESKNFESIDSFIWLENAANKPGSPWEAAKVVLFQVTVTFDHPVKGRGLLAVLKRLGINLATAKMIRMDLRVKPCWCLLFQLTRRDTLGGKGLAQLFRSMMQTRLEL